jgi:serine/threonine protein kinase
VFLVEDESRRKYALKVSRAPREDATLNHVLEMEAETHAALPQHPNLVRLVGWKVDKSSDPVYNVYYMLSEYCPRTLLGMMEQLLKKKESMPERDVLNFFVSATAAIV